MSQVVDILSTLDLLAALKTKLAAIDHPTLSGQNLFEVVEYSEDKNLAEALQDLIVVKKRVCFLVPAGDDYENTKVGRAMQSDRTTSLDLLIADQAYTKGGQAAAFGGANNVGVIAMKDIVTGALATDPQLGGLRWCALYPTEGAMLGLAADEAKQLSGRQAWVLNYKTPSGRIITPLTTQWQAP